VTGTIRFEQHGAAPSFVELTLHDVTLSRTWGRLGTAGAERAERFDDATVAARALETQIRRLERKGYAPGRHHPDLLAAVVADPDDASSYLVYGDWLLERDDPRGHLIARMSSSQPFDDLLAAYPCQLAPAWWTGCEPGWRLGFVRTMTCRDATDALLRRLFRHPSLVALQEIIVTERYPRSLVGWRSALATRPPTLRAIEMTGMDYLAPLRDEIPGLVL
jgi:uncharacterized protein (TIGR02996 family)